MNNNTQQNPLGGTYAGDITPEEAWEMLKEDSAVLVDVRTPAEWSFVGTPDLSPYRKEPALLAWRLYPSMDVNPHFMEQLQGLVGDKDAALLFLCRTGGRSKEAAIAATETGYARCYNIGCGFEGDLSVEGRRNSINGWRASGLPWRQS